VGVAVGSGQNNEEAYTSHDLFSIVKLLLEQASFLDNTSDYIGLGILSAILIFTVFIVPLMQVLFLMIRWFVPLKKQGQYRNFFVTEALQAWQYMEVYIFAVIIATWKLGSISEYMINDYCGGLEDFFVSTIYYGLLSESNAQCFRVNADVKSGMWILLAASIMLLLLNHFVRTAAIHQEKDEVDIPSSVSGCIEGRRGNISKESISNQAEESLDEIEKTNSSHSLVMPPPLFTDYYRWFLGSKDHSYFTPNEGAETRLPKIT